jgi:chromosome segregation ATPase
MNSQEPKEYKSPTRKLLAVFRDGRDPWKEKCAEAKRQIKTLKTRIYRLESRKQELTGQVKNLEEELDFLKAQLRRETYERARLDFSEEVKKTTSCP